MGMQVVTRPPGSEQLALMVMGQVALALFLLAAMPSTVQTQTTSAARTGRLFSASEAAANGRSTVSGPDIVGVPGIATIRSRWVAIDFAKLADARAVAAESEFEPAAAPATITLNLFDDVELSAVVERTARTASGTGYVLSGRLEGGEWGTWKLLVYDEVVSGTVRTSSGIYKIRTVDGAHAVNQIDTSELPGLEDDIRPGSPLSSPSEPDVPDSAFSTADPPPWALRSSDSSTPSDWPVVDVGVVYTTAAQEGADELEGAAGIVGLIDDMIDNTNTAYWNSGAMLRVRLAWMRRVECEGRECNDGGEALDNLPSRFPIYSHLQGRYSAVAGADLISWIVAIPDFGGLAKRPGFYSVVNYNQEYQYAFAHELGHNMYLLHDWWTSLFHPTGRALGLNGAYTYSYGYISKDCGWRTIMAYSAPATNPEGAPPHPCVGKGTPASRHFSNPDNYCKPTPDTDTDTYCEATTDITGERMGVPGESPTADVFDSPADAVRSLNRKRWEVADYWQPLSDVDVLYALYRTAKFRIVHSQFGSWFAACPALVEGPDCPLAFWDGVRADSEGRITELNWPPTGNIRTLGPLGEIPSVIGHLTELRSFSTGHASQTEHKFTGGIPAALGNLTKLEHLFLPGEWTGEIPTALGNLTHLRHLTLHGELTGEVPAAFSNLTRLEWLGLDGNRLTGEIPAALGNLTQLERLYLGSNRLTGEIPAALGNLTRLEWLRLAGNQFTGEIPADLGRLRLLTWLRIDSDTGLCLARDFPVNSPFFHMAQDQGVPVCSAASADLVVEFPAVSDNTLTPGQTFTFSATVRNQGNGASAVTTLRYYRSTDAAISTSDTIDGMPTAVDSLPAGGTQPAQVGLTAPATAGIYYYGACVDTDAGTGESDTTNNCSAGIAVTVADDETRTPGAREPDKDFNTLSAAGNNEPYGLWSDGTTMWVSDWFDAKIYAYSMATRGRDPGRDFDTLLAAGNDSPRGIWSDGATMWVSDFRDNKVYAYSMATRSHDPEKDFDAVGAAGSAGIWSDSITMWVADFLESKLYAHSMATRSHDPDKDFNALHAAGNQRPEGIWSDGVTMWVTDNGGFGEHAGGPPNKVYAYSLATRSREPNRDLDTLHAAGNHRPRGLWSDGATMWIVDVLEDKLFAYHLGTPGGGGLTPEQYERYRETWGTTAGSTSAAAARPVAFTDHPVRAGTPLKAIHFRELRMRIAALRVREGLPAVQWTDPALAAGVTPVRRIHLTELRAALDTVYEALGRPGPSYTDAAVRAGVTAIRTAHLMELRAAVTALE